MSDFIYTDTMDFQHKSVVFNAENAKTLSQAANLAYEKDEKK